MTMTSWSSYPTLKAVLMALPEVVLRERLRNELRICSDYLGKSLPFGSDTPFPFSVDIELTDAAGLCLLNGKVTARYHHLFRLVIGKDYPFTKPTVIWLTPIFHPNIMLPEDGGHVCTKLLDGWSFGSTLITFIKGIESMLACPNPLSPFGTDSCTAAAAYFNSGKGRSPPSISRPPKKGVRFL